MEFNPKNQTIDQLKFLSTADKMGGHIADTLLDAASLFMQAPAAIAVLQGPEHRFILANPFYQLTVQRTESQLVGKTVKEVFPELEGQKVFEMFDQVYISGQPFTSKEYPARISLYARGMVTLFFNFVIQPLKNRQGDVYGIMLHAVDVTEQVIARKKIEDSEAIHNELANAMPQLVWIADANGLVSYYNNRLAEFAGATQDENDKWHWEDLVHEDDLQRTNKAWSEAIKTGVLYEIEHRIQMKDGAFRWFLSRGIPQKDEAGHVVKWFGTATDIHENKIATEKLGDSEAYFRQLTDAVPAIIWITEPDGSCTYLNKQWYDYTGQSPEDAEGFGWLDATHPGDKAEAAKSFVEANDAQKSFSALYRLRDKNGDYRWAIDTGSPRFSATGVYEGMIGTVVDVHEEKIAEEKIRQSESRYRHIFEGTPVSVWEEDFSLVKESVMQLKKEGVTDFKTYFSQNKNQLQQLIQSVAVNDVNDITLRMLEADTKNELKKGLQQIFVEDTSEAFVGELEMIAAGGGRFEFETVLQTLKGRRLDILVHIDFPKGDNYRHVLVSLVDISKRVKAEVSLQAAKDQLEITFKNVPAAIYHFDNHGKILYLNEKGANQMGYNSVQEVLLEDDIFQFRKRLDETFLVLDQYGNPLPVEQSSAAITFRTQSPSEIVAEIVHKKTGDSFWLLSKSAPLFNDAGELIMVLTTSTDITIQKTGEDALRKLNTHLQIATSAAEVGTWSLHVPSGTLEWSALHKKMWGYNEGEKNLFYDDWHQVILPADKEEAFGKVEDARINHHQYEAVYRIKRVNDGAIKWMRSIGQYFYNEEGEAITLTGITLDITEQKKADEQFRTLAETLPQLVWMTNEQGQQEYASSRWKEYSGLEPTGFETWQLMVHPADMPVISATWMSSIETGSLYKTEVRLKNKQGEYRWHFVQGEPIRNEKGDIIKWIGAFTDIHDQKTISEKLEKLVAERTKELERSNEDLQQFAHVASHDLKEPIRKIRTFGSRLQDEYGNLLPERGKLYLEKMQSSAERMFGLIDGVLNYSTINSLESSKETVDLNVIIQNIETDLEVVIQQKTAEINKQTLPVVYGSSVLLNQLFYNLINNALKFSKPDINPVINIVSKKIKAKDIRQIEVADEQKEFIQISICDNGIGFGQEQAENIFKTFIRLNSRDKYEGTGLGLSLCKKIAERHNGDIYATAKPGEGACFYVLLPL